VSSDIQRFLSVVVGVLDLVFLIVLLRRPSRKFLLLIIYLAVDLVSVPILTLMDVFYEGSKAVSNGGSLGQRTYYHTYWTFEVAEDLLLFLLVIAFTYRATEGSPVRGAARNMLTGIVLIAIALPFVLFHTKFTPWPDGVWWNNTTQLLSFGAAIMNLALWTALIANKHRDPQLVTLSTGLGVMVTGGAVSRGFIHFVPLGFRWIPYVLLLLIHVFVLLAWCWAFRSPAKRGPAPSDVLSSA
jgi:hypothetical protein